MVASRRVEAAELQAGHQIDFDGLELCLTQPATVSPTAPGFVTISGYYVDRRTGENVEFSRLIHSERKIKVITWNTSFGVGTP